MTQKQLILNYISEFGSIVPARMYGEVYQGKMFGSELSRRCRELREEGKIISEPHGKFERYFMYDPSTNKKWVEIGQRLNAKTYHKPYTELTEEELKEKRETAKKWLAENPDHPKFAEALARYEKIEDEIALLNGDGLL